jgi:hypothetical protein
MTMKRLPLCTQMDVKECYIVVKAAGLLIFQQYMQIPISERKASLLLMIICYAAIILELLWVKLALI